MTPRRWPSPARSCCGCCAWRWPRRARWPGSAAGWSRNARSPPAAPPSPDRQQSWRSRRPAYPRTTAPAGAGRTDGRRKQDLLIALASQRHDLRRLPLSRVAGIASQIGAEVDLHPGTARRVLRAHVRSLHNGHPSQP